MGGTKSLWVGLACGFALAVAQAQVGEAELRIPRPTAAPPGRPLPPVGINVVRSRIHTNWYYSGVVVQAAKSNPLQLINPLAPARYGHSETNVARDPITGDVRGIRLFAVSY